MSRCLCFLDGVGGREGVVVPEILDENMTFVRPKKQKTPSPRTNYTVKYATARGHQKYSREWSAVKQRGRENKGLPDIAPKSFSLRVLCPFPRSHREIYTRNRPISEMKFLDDFWGPLSLPAPLFHCWNENKGWTKSTGKDLGCQVLRLSHKLMLLLLLVQLHWCWLAG